MRRDSADERYGVTASDFTASLLLHVAIIALFVLAARFAPSSHPPAPETVSVQMISAADLAAMQRGVQSPHPAAPQPKAEPEPKPEPEPEPAPEPVKPAQLPPPPVEPAKPEAKTPAKPALKPEAMPQPSAKPKPAANPTAKPAAKPVEEPFDPFAPAASSSDVQSKPKKRANTPFPDGSPAGGGLTDAEYQGYRDQMQRAIQEHWKVSFDHNVRTDPGVEVQLRRDGSVVSVKLLVSSGSGALDASIIRAVQAAAPFVVPQQQFELFRINRMTFHPIRGR